MFKNKIKKNYSKIAILLLVTVSIISISIYLIFPNSASAAWFNDSYAYRKYTSFTHNAALTDRRVSVSVDTATLITAGKMQSDCDDTRFTDASGKVLRYQLTGVCNNAATTYDVLIPTVINGLNAIYIYYGNPLATTGSTDISSFTSLSPSGGAASLATEEKGSLPILYWSFNDGNGTTAQDSSQNNNDATLTNGPTWQTEYMCVVDKCLYFDGSDDRAGKTYSSDTELDPGTASFTVSVWAKHASAISGTDTILSRADGLNGVGYKLYMNSSGNLCFGIDASAGSFPSDSACSTTTFNDSRWHFIQAVKNGTTDITLYIDGNQVAQDASITSSSISGTSAPLYVGIDADTSSNPWSGFIDEVKIYNYAKTNAQLQADKANIGGSDQTSASFGSTDPIKSLSDGLTGYWKMDEASWSNNCSTESVLDSSGNNNNGAACPNTTGPTGGGAGKFGAAGSFDGSNDAVDVDDSNSLDITATENLTISAWIRRTGEASFDDFQHILDKQNSQGTSSGYLFMVGSSSGCAIGQSDYLCFQIHDGTNRYYLTTNSTITPDSTWHHVVAVLDRNSVDNTLIYIDGVAQSVTRSGTLSSVGDLSNSNSLCIGKDLSGISCRTDTLYNFNGQLDEIRIYKRALSQQEVSQLYNFAPAPVAHWKFDENTGTTATDSSGNGNTSSAYTGNVKYTSGKFGSSAQFDGVDDVVRIVESTTLDLGGTTDSYTVGAWVKMPTTANCNSGDCFIVTKYDGVASTLPFMIALDSSERPYFEMLDGTNDVFSDPTATAALNDNKWHYLAAVRNVAADRVEFYVDGVLKSTATDTTTATTKNDADVSIGSGSVSYVANDFQGYIDEVKIYNYVRTPKQIVQDMNAGHPTVGTPVSSAVGHWSFDEGYGTTANDKSPNANNLTLSTASWTTSGKFATAWNGTGALWLSRADDADFDFSTGIDFSLSTWVKSDSTSNPAASEYIISKETSSAGYALWFNTGGEIVCGIDDDATSFPEDSAGDTASNTDYYDNTWHHIVCTRDTTTGRLSLYIDGRLFDSDTSLSATGDLSNTDSLTIGDRNATNDTDDFNGDIDETKIYRAALSADEVKVEYNQGKSQVLGAISTESDGITASNASVRDYCIPGDTTSCNPPQAEWKLDENTGTSANDTTGNGNVGTLTNSPTWARGKIGAGLNFTAASSQYVTAADSSTLDSGGALTIETWIKPTATSLDSNYHDIIGKGDSGAANMDYSLSLLAADKLSLYWATAASYEDWQTSGTSIFTANQWYHVVATRNSALNAVTFYVNGVKYTATNTGSDVAPVNSTYALAIGRPGEYPGQYFDGAIDNVKLYNYERTQAQILWSYNRGAPVAHYKMDECTGTTINDASGNSITGTLTIGATGTYTSAGTCSSGTSTQSWNGGTTGKYSSSGAFDGTDDYITTATNSKLQGGTNLTLSAWINAASLSSNHSPVALFGSSTQKGYWFNIPSTGEPQFYISRDGSAQDSVTGVPGQITTGTWAHMVGTYDGTTMRIYLNGKLLNSTTQSGTIHTVATANAFAIGRLGATSADYFSGQVDDVRVYNYVATSAQIKTIYNEGSAVRFGPQTGSP